MVKPILFPKDAQTIKEGVAFSYGTGSKEIYIITDPECPYCTRFEKSVHGKLSDYTVHVIFFPLSFHKKAPAMVDWIMQGKDDAAKKERFEQVMLKGSTAYSSLIKDANKPYVYTEAIRPAMKKMQAAVLELNVRGTPAIYDKDFNPVSQDQLFKGMKISNESKSKNHICRYCLRSRSRWRNGTYLIWRVKTTLDLMK